jgi:DNA integrity scanning protein DisA with diadenylate cyclase activity
MTIFIEQTNGFSMRRVRDTPSGVQLIIAAVCIILLVLPGGVFAATLDTVTPGAEVPTGILPDVTSEPVTPVPTGPPAPENTTGITPNVTPIPTTPVPPVFIHRENPTGAVNPAPLLIFDPPVIKNLTTTLYGIVSPGSANVTVVSVLWDWGDNQAPEYHGFPNSHVYSSPGTYTFSITARQSDGQNVTGTTKISVGQPLLPPTTTVPVTLNTTVTTAPGGPGGPGMVIHAPLLTLLEPAIDRRNVTLNGNLNAGSPDVTVEWVTVDWNDGSITRSSDLPVAHRYSGAGIFTVSVTGNQSDGQSTTKKIALEIKEEIPTPPGPTPSGPAPQNDLPGYLIIIAMAITGVVIVSVVLITQRRKETPVTNHTPKAFPARSGPLPANQPSAEELKTICSGTGVAPDVLDAVIHVAVEIAREGREGQAIGTAFVVGDTQNVLIHSKQFVLNPFHGHQETERQITDVGIQGTIKEFAQLDGAFLITGAGVVEAAGRCITVDLSQVNLPGGMGSRHLSVAGITRVTSSIGIVVSQSGGQISIFKKGKIVYIIRS